MTLNITARAGLAGTAALAAFALAGTTTAQAAPTPQVGAASYLASQLAAGGHHFSTSFDGTDYADYGLTNDAILALASTGAGQTEMNNAANYMVANGAEYYSYGTDRYAGALAKQIVMLQATGRSSASLVTELRGLETPSGRFSDRSDYGDYSNTISQAWAMVAVKRSGVNPSTNAVAYLKAQQCTDGGFRLSAGTGCVSDPDVTSFAVQALVAVGDNAAAARGTDYLATRQEADGGVGGGPTTEGTNANSSGLAAVAFSITGKTANATRAADFVKSLQFGCDAPAALRGAVAYNRAAYTTKLAAGTPSDQENRSTAQAALAFTLKPYLTITAGGTAGASFDCGTATSTTTSTSTTSTSATSSTSTTSTPATTTSTSATSTVTGPPVVTDGPTADGGADLGVLAGAGAVLVTIGAGVAAYGRRRK